MNPIPFNLPNESVAQTRNGRVNGRTHANPPLCDTSELVPNLNNLQLHNPQTLYIPTGTATVSIPVYNPFPIYTVHPAPQHTQFVPASTVQLQNYRMHQSSPSNGSYIQRKANSPPSTSALSLFPRSQTMPNSMPQAQPPPPPQLQLPLHPLPPIPPVPVNSNRNTWASPEGINCNTNIPPLPLPALNDLMNPLPPKLHSPLRLDKTIGSSTILNGSGPRQRGSNPFGDISSGPIATVATPAVLNADSTVSSFHGDTKLVSELKHPSSSRSNVNGDEHAIKNMSAWPAVLSTMPNVSVAVSTGTAASSSISTFASEPAPSNEVVFPCEICGRRFRHKSNLKTHKRIHDPDAPQCSYCSKKFARESNLKQHLRVHTNERPFECPYCTKKFKQPHSLNDHLRTHTAGEKPYVCRFCGKQYSSKSGLNSHVKKHHHKSGLSCRNGAKCGGHGHGHGQCGKVRPKENVTVRNSHPNHTPNGLSSNGGVASGVTPKVNQRKDDMAGTKRRTVSNLALSANAMVSNLTPNIMK